MNKEYILSTIKNVHDSIRILNKSIPVLIYMFLHISLNCIHFGAFHRLWRVFSYHIGANENNRFFTHIGVISICNPYLVFFHMHMRLTMSQSGNQYFFNTYWIC